MCRVALYGCVVSKSAMHEYGKLQRLRRCMLGKLTIVERDRVFGHPLRFPWGSVHHAGVKTKNLHFLYWDPIGEDLDCQGAAALGEAVGRARVHERMTTHVDGGSGDVDEILCAPPVSYCMQHCGRKRNPALPSSLQALRSAAYGNAPRNGGAP